MMTRRGHKPQSYHHFFDHQATLVVYIIIWKQQQYIDTSITLAVHKRVKFALPLIQKLAGN